MSIELEINKINTISAKVIEKSIFLKSETGKEQTKFILDGASVPSDILEFWSNWENIENFRLFFNPIDGQPKRSYLSKFRLLSEAEAWESWAQGQFFPESVYQECYSKRYFIPLAQSGNGDAFYCTPIGNKDRNRGKIFHCVHDDDRLMNLDIVFSVFLERLINNDGMEFRVRSQKGASIVWSPYNIHDILPSEETGGIDILSIIDSYNSQKYNLFRTKLSVLLSRPDGRSRDAIDVVVNAVGKSAIDIPDEDGDTLLMSFAQAGNVTAVRELLRLGANPDLKNNYGDTARDKAMWSSNSEVVSEFP